MIERDRLILIARHALQRERAMNDAYAAERILSLGDSDIRAIKVIRSAQKAANDHIDDLLEELLPCNVNL